MRASLSVHAESGTFALVCADGAVKLQDPHCILEGRQLFLIIHEVYSDDSVD